MTKNSRKITAILITVIAMLVVADLTAMITIAVVNSRTDDSTVYLPKTDGDSEGRFDRLNEVYERLMDEFYMEPSGDALIQGAIDGMMSSLQDPYTMYFTPEQLAASNEEHSGLYDGVGILVSSDKEGRLAVLRVFKDSPAMEAGLLPGDVIIAADGQAVSAETTEIMNEAVSRIKGETGTYVELTVLRKGEILKLSSMRGNVNMNRVEYSILDGNIGYLVLYEFFGDAAAGFEEALDAFEKADVNGIIVDVRSNPGGQLDICLDICDDVLPKGVIVYTEDRSGDQQHYYSDDKYFNRPMVVLVNGMSASASEIFASAVKDYGVGTLVGTQTFGKGIVQKQYQFASDGAGMQLTTSRYFTPNGQSIHGTGVAPDVVVELQDSYDASIYSPDMENDNQLKTAYDTLIQMISEN